MVGTQTYYDIFHKLYNVLQTRPNLSVAAVVRKARTPLYLLKQEEFLETLNGLAVIFKDFSFIVVRINVIGEIHYTYGTSVFDFIDRNVHQLCKPEDLLPTFVAKVKARFGFEHMIWLAGINPTTGQPRTDAKWLQQKAAASTSKEIE